MCHANFRKYNSWDRLFEYINKLFCNTEFKKCEVKLSKRLKHIRIKKIVVIYYKFSYSKYRFIDIVFDIKLKNKLKFKMVF